MTTMRTLTLQNHRKNPPGEVFRHFEAEVFRHFEEENPKQAKVYPQGEIQKPKHDDRSACQILDQTRTWKE
jgi:hypothetical protein